jgi:hypothetical protein
VNPFDAGQLTDQRAEHQVAFASKTRGKRLIEQRTATEELEGEDSHRQLTRPAGRATG